MRRSILIPAALAVAALGAPAVPAAADTSQPPETGFSCAAPTPPSRPSTTKPLKLGSIEYQRAWSDAWHNANPGKLLPGPQPPGSVGYYRQWEQACLRTHPAG